MPSKKSVIATLVAASFATSVGFAFAQSSSSAGGSTNSQTTPPAATNPAMPSGATAPAPSTGQSSSGFNAGTLMHP